MRFIGMRYLGIFLSFIFFTSVNAEQAQPANQPELTPQQKQYIEAINEAEKVKVVGPAKIELIDQGYINLPASYLFVPKVQATKIMEAIGNSVDASFQGLIYPPTDTGTFLTVDYHSSGYISDEDAKNWDIDGMLDGLKSATEAENKVRVKNGIPELKIKGWIEQPHYDANLHSLIWAIVAKDEPSEPGSSDVINYNTYKLGREGYFSVNLITTSDLLANQKGFSGEVLTALNFNQGKSYKDFNAETDKIAEYGIAALVGGIAAKKLGLLATLGVLLAKFGKLIFGGLVGFGALASRFKKKGKVEPEVEKTSEV